MDGGRLRRPPLISYQFYIKKIKNTKKHIKYIITMENMQTYAKIQASMQHGLCIFTCEISSVNNTLGTCVTYT